MAPCGPRWQPQRRPEAPPPGPGIGGTGRREDPASPLRSQDSAPGLVPGDGGGLPCTQEARPAQRPLTTPPWEAAGTARLVVRWGGVEEPWPWRPGLGQTRAGAARPRAVQGSRGPVRRWARTAGSALASAPPARWTVCASGQVHSSWFSVGFMCKPDPLPATLSHLCCGEGSRLGGPHWSGPRPAVPPQPGCESEAPPLGPAAACCRHTSPPQQARAGGLTAGATICPPDSFQSFPTQGSFRTSVGHGKCTAGPAQGWLGSAASCPLAAGGAQSSLPWAEAGRWPQ